MDLELVDETGKTVALGSIIDRPTIVTLVYYSCPSVCRPLLKEVTATLGKLQKMDLVPGEDYRVITISFDDTDSPDGSARLKKEYYTGLPDAFPESAWTFLTGDSAAISRFTEAVGFQFNRTGEDFAHPATLIVLAADGKITRYMFGSPSSRSYIDDNAVAGYLPADVKMALLEASQGRVGATLTKLVKFCFSYDPEGRKYVLNATRIVGGSTLLGVLGLLLFLTASGKRREKVGQDG